MLLGFVLGPLMEENLRRAMLIARGDATVFITRPISGGLARRSRCCCWSLPLLPTIRKRRDEVFVESRIDAAQRQRYINSVIDGDGAR